MNDTQEKIQKWTLDLGKVDANGRGRKSNRVTVKVELRHKVNDVAPYLDVDLNPCREFTELSIVGAVWNAAGSDWLGCGQNREEITKLFPGNARVQRLVEIWERYHLNGMKSGTRTQNNLLKDARVKAVYPKSQYDLDCEVLEKANLLHVAGPGNPNYKYGGAWLVEPLPAEVEAEVVALCGALTAKTAAATSGQEDPKDFAEEHGITADVERAASNPAMDDDHVDMRHWRVTLRRGKARLVVPFSQGSAHTKPPTAIEVLGCLASDAQETDETFEDWCGYYGYETDSRKAEKTYKAVKKSAADLKRFLGDGLFRALLEDSNG
jgi:hypothetical protein